MVKYVEYQGKKLPIRISYYAFKTLKEKSGKRFEELGEDIELYEPLFFAALQAGAWAVNQELQIKEEDTCRVLDACFTDFIKLIPQFMLMEQESKTKETKQPKNVKPPKQS